MKIPFSSLKPGYVQPILRAKMLNTSCAVAAAEGSDVDTANLILSLRFRFGLPHFTNWVHWVIFTFARLSSADCLPSFQVCFPLHRHNDFSSCSFLKRSCMRKPFACHLISVNQGKFIKLNSLDEQKIFLWKSFSLLSLCGSHEG